ncbi:hypothetical protein V1264_017614 [Littorina saxatilis]|uniref:Uncharacterized protein n=1 Tax=Littorina saxatilis TaxID=31220 RepID=A0AAN9BJJ3_9CAEN
MYFSATTVNAEGQEASTKGQDKKPEASSNVGVGIGIASLLAIIAVSAAVLFFRKRSTAPPDEKDKTPEQPVNPTSIDNSGSGELAEDEASGSHSQSRSS